MMFQDVAFTLLNTNFQLLESNRRFDSGPSHFLLCVVGCRCYRGWNVGSTGLRQSLGRGVL